MRQPGNVRLVLRAFGPLPLLVLLGACAASPSPKHRAPLVISDVGAPPEGRTPQLAGTRSRCVAHEDVLDAEVALRLELKGPTLATLIEPTARVELQAGTPRLELELGGVALWTPYDDEAHPLHLRRALAFAQVLTPAYHAPIEWLASGSAGQRVGYRAGSALNEVFVEEDVACADLGLNLTPYELDESEVGTAKQLVGKVPVSPAPGALPTLVLPQGTDPLGCREVKRERGFALIEIDDHGAALLSGWVPTSVVRDEEAPGGFSLTGLGGGGRGYGRVPDRVDFTRCKEEVRLFLRDAQGSARPVGIIRAETRFEVLDEQPDDERFALVDVWQSWIASAGEDPLYFLVERSELDACEGMP